MKQEKIDKLLQEKAEMLKKGDLVGFEKLEEVYHRKRAGKYISDLILGANDGIITTFVVVAGATGAGLSPLVIVILGFANILGDAVSMGFGNYLGQKSEQDYNRGQRQKEEWEVKKFPEVEHYEIRKIFEKWGFGGKDLDRAEEIVTSNKKVWVDVMMKEELGIIEESTQQPIKGGAMTFFAFVAAGIVPLIPFLVPPLLSNAQWYSTALAGIELFIIGAMRSTISPQKWLKGGFEMLLVGVLAGGIAYGVGFIVDRIMQGVV